MTMFLFNFALVDTIITALENCIDSVVQLIPGHKITDLEYADDIAAQSDFSRLENSGASFHVCWRCFGSGG